MNTMQVSTIKCKKLATTVSGLSNCVDTTVLNYFRLTNYRLTFI